MYIWQQEAWPKFTWQEEVLAEQLRNTRLKQGILLGKASSQAVDEQESLLATLLANIVHSSAIEGEKVNAFSVRSSLAKRLGVSEERPFPTSKQTDALAEIMLDAVTNLNEPLTLSRILHWHQCLFVDASSSLISKPIVGGQLRGDLPMQVVSGRLDNPKVHFEAPSREVLEQELDIFLEWFNSSLTNTQLDPLLRAGIAHFWFLTLHPLEDGNGRLARLLTDLALAQAEQQSVRFYAMSVTILAKRKSYYAVLEASQKGNLDITQWLSWFLTSLEETFDQLLVDIDRTLFKVRFWQRLESAQLLAEQVKVLNRMLDGGFIQGINATQYQRVAKVSKATATRHLAALVAQGCLVKSASGGRSQRYFLPIFEVDVQASVEEVTEQTLATLEDFAETNKDGLEDY